MLTRQDSQQDNKSKPSHQNDGAGDSGMRLARAEVCVLSPEQERGNFKVC